MNKPKLTSPQRRTLALLDAEKWRSLAAMEPDPARRGVLANILWALQRLGRAEYSAGAWRRKMP